MTSGESTGAAGGKRPRTVYCGTPYKRPMSSSEGDACDGVLASPPTMADVIRERKKKAGGAGLGTLRRRLAAAARRPRDARPDRAKFVVNVSSCVRVPLEGAGGSLSRAEADAVLLTLYAGSAAPRLATCDTCAGELCDARLSWAEGAAASSYGFRSALELPCHRLLLAARSRFFRSVMSRRCGVAGTSAGAVCVDEKVLPRRFARALLHAAYTDQVDLSLISRSSSSPSSTTSAGSGGTLRGSVSRGSAAAMLDDAFQLYEIARTDGKVIELEEVVSKLRWDIIGLSEVRREGEDSIILESGNLFYYREGDQQSQGGVGFIVHKSLVNNVVKVESVSSRVAYLILGITKRFLEMPIVAQGCEDAAARALSADTLPRVLRWACAPHASAWLHRWVFIYSFSLE
ncbi:jg13526 [Pararge aegeria aegeria]|uniref:Jg13526 protein n=1 Tax=Pararge aegeria aegeria TaxID=348720 RepID=A0A8S4QWA4_9NEOP|nr:jg13526 [Pararge aegeria aegeria]